MIRFFMRCSVKALSIHRKWFFAVLIPVIIYLGVAASIPDRFVVKQDISATDDTLISLSPRATDVRSLKELVAEPGLFFQNRFALALLSKRLEIMLPAAKPRIAEVTLADRVGRNMTLHMKEGNMVSVIYAGEDRKEGKIMVGFYSQRLIRQAEDYLAMNRAAIKEGAAIPRKIGRAAVSEERSLWSRSRLVPALVILGISLLVLIILITLLEWFKPSFRSERHIAEYLRVPILGAFPDLKRIPTDRRAGG